MIGGILKTALVVGAAWIAAGAAQAQTGNPGGAINDNLGAPDYGVCRGLDPKCFHDWPRPQMGQPRILVFSRTGGPRHANLGPPLAPGMNPPLGEANAAQEGLLRLAAQNGWAMDYTEDLEFMTDLGGYNAVVFLSTSRDMLNDDAKTALRQYVRAGGGFVAIHNAFGGLYNWPWYEGLLGGANFYNHGPHRTGDVVLTDSRDASTKGLPARFGFKDEWYNLVPFPTKVRFLARVDEASWKPNPPPTAYPPGTEPRLPPGPRLPRVVGSHPGHGDFHPVAWCQYYDGGKAWLTTLGHDAGAFGDPSAFEGAAEFQQMLVGGLKSVMGLEPFCQP